MSEQRRGRPRKKGYEKGGWRHKYIIQKTNGHPLDPEARYFVLRFDAPGGDPHARVAMRAYADSVRSDNPRLADDVIKKVKEQSDKFNPAWHPKAKP
jgi:hypothetical protein